MESRFIVQQLLFIFLKILDGQYGDMGDWDEDGIIENMKPIHTVLRLEAKGDALVVKYVSGDNCLPDKSTDALIFNKALPEFW